MLHELIDLDDQILDAAAAAATDDPLSNQSKSAFHLVKSGRVGRRVVNVETWPDGEPAVHLTCLGERCCPRSGARPVPAASIRLRKLTSS